MKKKTENFKRLNDREREVLQAVADILDVTTESTAFTENLKVYLEGY